MNAALIEVAPRYDDCRSTDRDSAFTSSASAGMDSLVRRSSSHSVSWVGICSRFARLWQSSDVDVIGDWKSCEWGDVWEPADDLREGVPWDRGTSISEISSCRFSDSSDCTSLVGNNRLRIVRHSSRDWDRASKVLLHVVSRCYIYYLRGSCLLPWWNHSLPMFVIITWLWRSTPQTLSTRLTSVTSDFTSFAFGASMWSCDSLGYTTGWRFRRIFRLLWRWTWRRKSLNFTQKSAWYILSRLGGSSHMYETLSMNPRMETWISRYPRQGLR